MIISLDLGLKTGVAIKHDDYTITSEVIDWKKRHNTFGKQLLGLNSYLWALGNKNKSNIEVCIEVPHGGYFNASKILFGFMAIVYAFSESWDHLHITVHEYSPKAVKKFQTGNGNADKQQMVESVNRCYSKHITDHNEADALAMLYYHLEQKELK